MKRYYTKDHEWIECQNDNTDIARVGISDYAQQQLGDVVFVELPEIGKKCEKETQISVIESVKAASDVYAPVTGTVSSVNKQVETEPNLVNEASETEGWFFEMKIDTLEDLNLLMDESAYMKYLESLD